MTTLAAVRGIENLGPAGRRATVDVANSLGINPDWLVKVMSFETDGTFSPKKKNAAGSGATGLIQFMPTTAALLGYTIPQLERMSQEEQIRGPVFKYLSSKGRMNSLEDVYLAVFYPSAIGQSDSYIIGDKNGTERQQKIYRQNIGFDRSGSGVIRRGDVVATIRGIPQARVEVPGSDFLEPSSSLPPLVTLPIQSSTGEPEVSPDNMSDGNSTSQTLPLLSFCANPLKFIKGLLS